VAKLCALQGFWIALLQTSLGGMVVCAHPRGAPMPMWAHPHSEQERERCIGFGEDGEGVEGEGKDWKVFL